MNRNTVLRHSYPSVLRVIPFLTALFLLAGCLGATPTATPGPIQTPTATATPTATPTPVPLGHPLHPLILGLVATSPDQQLDQPASDLAKQLSSAVHFSISARVYPGYKELLEGMANGETHITFLPPLTYLYASQRGLAESAILLNHFGVYQFGTQFLANAASGYTIYYDPLNGKNSAEADIALAQFDGKKPCYVDANSTSGYIVAAGLLEANHVITQAPAFTQSHASVVRSLYVKGICDFGATFSISGDPRTASSVLDDLPDAMARIPIVWKSDPLIPNLNVSYLAGLQNDLRAALTTAFLDLSATPAGRELLSAAAGGYEIEAMKPIEDPLYDPLRSFAAALKLDLPALIGK